MPWRATDAQLLRLNQGHQHSKTARGKDNTFSGAKPDPLPFIVQECHNEGSVHTEIRDGKGYQVILSILLTMREVLKEIQY